jgi:hypothetical protein
MTVSNSDSPRRPIVKGYQLFAIIALTYLIFGCSDEPDPIDIKKKPPATAATAVSQETTQRPDAPTVTSGNTSRGIGRQLDEAGSVSRDHPAAGMERPDKWKTTAKPTIADVSQAAKFQAIDAQELGELESAGMKEVKVFLTDSPLETLLEDYREKSPRARVVEHDGVKLLTIPVKEGTMLVTTTAAEEKTLVCEFLLPKRGSYNTVEWAESFQEAARQKMK